MREPEYALCGADASRNAAVRTDEPFANALAGHGARALPAGSPPSPALEQALLRLGLDRGTFEAACREAERNGSSADEELIAAGLVDEAALARALGAVLGLCAEPIGPGASLLRDGRGAFDASERHAKTCDGAMRPRLFLAPRLERIGFLADRISRSPQLATTLRVTSLSEIAMARGAASGAERSTRARALAALDWPRSRLEVFFVCEANDPETIAAVERAIAGEPNFSVIATPRTAPTTKPKALNFALPLTRGEFVVLYDAEDRPDPGQLRAAHAAFRSAPVSLACVQAPLVIRNAADGWLETLFALEYAVLFRAILPWLARRGLPLPLGGTSNHFRRAALVEAGGWDSHNVAEDADLGIRLSRLGYRIGTIASPTSEIAPSRFLDWRNQRTRWIKGWCQTWLVHMRDPRLACRQLGLRAFLTFQILFGGMIAASLMHVVFAGHLLAATHAYLTTGEIHVAAGVLAAVDLLNIALAYTVFILTARLVASEAERPLLRRLWSLWFYWLIVSLAGLRAIGQLVHAPHMWEKTPHREPAGRA
ncbi:glycosyltransferase [Aureimonas flava]|uniref:Glycosyltransferase n=1 Tax=Aureimonas flava TaxID=2320271 RepID=A0A3A1WPG5_9HYPH|nr:glycosyltransferase family 2 protein [Aureimonas flava]RIX99201.1 glycosyltransferase [Aureimonas flava]